MLTQTRIGALLHEDHMETVQMLQALEELVGTRSKGPPAVDEAMKARLTGIESTIRAEVEKHFGFEEGHLFPVFTALGESGIVIMLTHEHRAILPLALQVADLAAAAVQGGFDAQGWQDFRDAASELVERELFHIQKEEMGLLSAISALVDPETDARLAETYQGVMG